MTETNDLVHGDPGREAPGPTSVETSQQQQASASMEAAAAAADVEVDEDALEDPAPADAPAEVRSLKKQQLTALHILTAGGLVTDAAEEAGVSRRTVHRWMNKDRVFAAALAGWRRRTRESAEDRLLAMSDAALDTLEEAVVQDNLKASVVVLKGLGILTPAPRRRPKAADTKRIERINREIVREVEQKLVSLPNADPKQVLSIVTSSIKERLTQTFEERS